MVIVLQLRADAGIYEPRARLEMHGPLYHDSRSEILSVSYPPIINSFICCLPAMPLLYEINFLTCPGREKCAVKFRPAAGCSGLLSLYAAVRNWRRCRSIATAEHCSVAVDHDLRPAASRPPPPRPGAAVFMTPGGPCAATASIRHRLSIIGFVLPAAGAGRDPLGHRRPPGTDLSSPVNGGVGRSAGRRSVLRRDSRCE